MVMQKIVRRNMGEQFLWDVKIVEPLGLDPIGSGSVAKLSTATPDDKN